MNGHGKAPFVLRLQYERGFAEVLYKTYEGRSAMNANRLLRCLQWMLMVSLAAAGGAQGAATDLATVPLVTSTTTAVLPNLMFVLDDSGSMAWAHMPDVSSDAGSSVVWNLGYYGARSSQCNGVYYNPDFTYTPPVYADGTSYPNASFTAAWSNGFLGNAGGTVNLSTNYKYSDTSGPSSDGSGQAAYYYAYTGSQTTAAQKNYNSNTSDFYDECNSALNASPGNGVFVKVTVTSNTALTGTTTQNGVTVNNYDYNTQNFANWYSYYRTRMLMMKTAAGQAFKAIDNHYRVGFMAINSNSAFLNPDTFENTQKTSWYTKLYGMSASGSTPLRAALSKAGRFFAGELSLSGVTVNDPVQYSCQQNFSILSTDGYWNTGAGFQVDGSSAVGNQDGSAPRPYFDGAVTTILKSTSQLTQTQVQVSQSTSQIQSRTTQIQQQTSRLQKRTKSFGVWGSWSNVSSCTVSSTVQCQYTAWSSWSNASSCTAVAQSPGPTSYTVGTAVQCQTTDTGWVAASSCTPGSSNGKTVACQTLTTGPALVDSCTPQNASSGNSWTATICSPSTVSGPTGVQSCSPVTASSANNYTATTCNTVTTGPTAVASCTAQEPDASNNWTTTTCDTSVSGGTSDTLADIAQYYYMTDLRSSALSNCTGALGGSTDVCANNVPSTGQDGASWQHMTLFTLGLGASGRMIFSPTYLSDGSGDYFSVKNGLAANPPSVCSWQASGSGACNWPFPGMANASDGKIENIDDLWHAAVNGRGTYFSATNPSSLSTGITNALSGVSARFGASASATTSNPNVTSGDNFVFSTSFTTQEWTGQLVRQQINLSTGTLPAYVPTDTSTYDWEAQSLLDAKPYASRTIYFNNAGTLTPFLWTNLTGAEQAYFSSGNISTLSQFCATGATCLSAQDQTNAAGENLVNFLRGDRGNEGGAADTAKYYRLRAHVLGDMVNAAAVYVKGSLYEYADSGYSDFVAANATRQSMVYVAANDGMLHAFRGDTGAESWAYIPSLVMPNLYKLADKNYANLHQYFVDGTPTVGDICVSACATNNAVWKTILVGGLRGGGHGYYALDITNPATPALLWEYTDANMGYTYGNPVITKLADASHTWVVLLTSGYNNIGDGVGRLYVLNAASGALIRSISTGVGSAATPSGLARINAWADHAMVDNTALRVYGGDLLGNVWRFDINGNVGAAGYDAQLLANLTDAAGNPQPVTGKPELGDVKGVAMVYVGTGRYLGVTDQSDTSQQSFYGIKDSLAANTTADTAVFGHPRDSTCSAAVTANCFVQQVQAIDTCPSGMPSSVCAQGESVRTSTNTAVDLTTKNGWFVDLPDAGERANTDPLLVFGTLVFNSNIPAVDACSMGGYSYWYFLDYRTGGFLSPAAIPITGGSTASSGVVGQKLGNAIASSPVFVKLPSDTGIGGGAGGGYGDVYTRLSDGTNIANSLLIDPTAMSARKLSWRELINDQ